MAKLSGRPVGIIGTGEHLPERVVTNDDIARMVDTSDEWIVSHTGIRERRVIGGGETNVSLSAEASRRALDDAGISAEQVDMVIVGTNSPDTLFPGVGPQVQHAIGASRAGGMDVQSGCPGGLHALTAAAGGVASGIWDQVVVVGSEALSRIVDWTDRNTCPLFGDGAAALVVAPWREGAIRITHADMRSAGDQADLITLPAGMSREPASEETVRGRRHFVKMQGPEVYKFVNRIMPEYIEGFCESCGVALGDVDLWIFHQANVRILDSIQKRIGISPDRSLVNLDRYGNTSAASIFLGLHEARAEGRIGSGQRIVMASFGAGMTYGAILLES